MRHAIVLVNLGDFADPRLVVEIGSLAEASGWDGLFRWDRLALAWGPSADPLTALAAVAAARRSACCATSTT
ncbi:MAG: hypothetical protein A2X23_09025 [Chloroflexi bacterium GWC2_73_18]|nr:MAG: hypothetical protein A2X23_09025 [Chloroflexi bacterium GWC2_73_18]